MKIQKLYFWNVVFSSNTKTYHLIGLNDEFEPFIINFIDFTRNAIDVDAKDISLTHESVTYQLIGRPCAPMSDLLILLFRHDFFGNLEGVHFIYNGLPSKSELKHLLSKHYCADTFSPKKIEEDEARLDVSFLLYPKDLDAVIDVVSLTAGIIMHFINDYYQEEHNAFVIDKNQLQGLFIYNEFIGSGRSSSEILNEIAKNKGDDFATRMLNGGMLSNGSSGNIQNITPRHAQEALSHEYKRLPCHSYYGVLYSSACIDGLRDALGKLCDHGLSLWETTNKHYGAKSLLFTRDEYVESVKDNLSKWRSIAIDDIGYQSRVRAPKELRERSNSVTMTTWSHPSVFRQSLMDSIDKGSYEDLIGTLAQSPNERWYLSGLGITLARLQKRLLTPNVNPLIVPEVSFNILINEVKMATSKPFEINAAPEVPTDIPTDVEIENDLLIDEDNENEGTHDVS